MTKAEIKVYYDASIWDREILHKQGMKPGIKQKVDWRFNYLEREYIIPYIYRFSKGIVLDIVTPLGEEEIQTFIKKYEHLNEEELSISQEEQIEMDRPYKYIEPRQVWINGECTTRGWSSTSAVLLPFQDEDESMLRIKEAYRDVLKSYEFFSCQRICIPYPNNIRGYKRIRHFKRGDQIKSLKFTTHKQYRTYPIDESFTLTKLKPEIDISFTHPITGEIHKIEFKWEEQIEIPFPKAEIRKVYGEMASYRITPLLGEEEYLEFDQSMQFKQRKISTQKYVPESTGSIGIIGGASGPTSVFIAKGKDANKIRYCYSKLSEHPENHTFYLKGIRVLAVREKNYEFVGKI